MLDIFSFLWENIVLEVPLRFTKVKDLSKFHGDGWKLISEEERNQTSNPFNDLLKEMERVLLSQHLLEHKVVLSVHLFYDEI